MSKNKIVLPDGPMLKNLELVFSQTAWSKLMFFRHNVDDIEVSGQGISFTKNLLMIDDFGLIKQEGTGGHTEYDPDGWICFLEEMRENYGLIPRQCNNVWIHTHPSFSTNPSSIDETNWRERTQEEARDFFVMCIVSNDDRSAYARLMMTEPVKIITEIPVRIDFSTPPPNLDVEELCKEFKEKVTKRVCQPVVKTSKYKTFSKKSNTPRWNDKYDKYAKFPVYYAEDYGDFDPAYYDWEDRELEFLSKELDKLEEEEKKKQEIAAKTIKPAKKRS